MLSSGSMVRMSTRLSANELLILIHNLLQDMQCKPGPFALHLDKTQLGLTKNNSQVWILERCNASLASVHSRASRSSNATTKSDMSGILPLLSSVPTQGVLHAFTVILTVPA